MYATRHHLKPHDSAAKYLSGRASPRRMPDPQSTHVARFGEHVFHGVHDLHTLLNTPPNESTDLLVYLASVGMTSELARQFKPYHLDYEHYLRCRQNSHRAKIDHDAGKYERSLSNQLPDRYPDYYRTIQDLRRYVELGRPIHRIGERKWAYFNATLVANSLAPMYYWRNSPLRRQRQVALMHEMLPRIAKDLSFRYGRP